MTEATHAPAKPAKPEPRKIPRPLPRADIYAKTKPFWEAANEGRLMMQFCRDTARFQWFPRSGSVYTGKRNIEWREVSGRGTVYSWTVAVAPWPGHEDRVPYVCALVELDEGVRMLANLFNVPADEVAIGMPVKLMWERLSETYNYPAFEPA
ncbi:Zn-ribbon domain-containing OB-fold protein [Piscinibacter koreensis]|uniref:Zn-ribbon domain-containing OB-fold protein n=1 Tax=Piscinibacter koreensis TaxID=2742824 RepID=A0A7Y6NQ48_9BURK|nr:Zn-ribbon domain-containing OB-fold protein [Schlegelella koreensis]NUZ07302.1 Zn-ribbon domain-containing OB-fold protein [Schlegelella koreensis]